MQQYAESQIQHSGGQRWTPAARHATVMKSVLMNSTEKLQGVLGADRTVVKYDGTTSWAVHQDTIAPLNHELGTGQLNVDRAIQQFSPGQYYPGSVPSIAWSYDNVNVNTTVNKYAFTQTLSAGDYVSITLNWDRVVQLDAQNAPFDKYKPGDGFIDNGFYNLDLYVMPAGDTNLDDEIASSVSITYNLEHVFATIPSTGNYEIWVLLNDQNIFASQDYALAWWAGGSTSHASMGDFNGDGVVNQADYDVWRLDYGSNNAMADANGDGKVDSADYVAWRDHLGQSVGSGAAAVPEPTLAIYLSVVVAIAFQVRRRS